MLVWRRTPRRSANSAFKKQVATVSEDTNDMLDDYVSLKKCADEDTATAYSRMTRDRGAGFLRIWQHLRNVQNHV